MMLVCAKCVVPQKYPYYIDTEISMQCDMGTSFLWGICAYTELSGAVVCTPLVLFISQGCSRVLAITDQTSYARISMAGHLLKTRRMKVSV